MNSPIQTKILKALFVALKPIIRMLLRAGVGYREFSEIAKATYIHEAANEYGLRGRPTNISRIAVMTGMTRKQISKFRENDLDELLSYSVGISPGALVLQYWHTDEKYCDSSGKAKILDYENEEVSFTSLVKTYAGDIPPGALRTELKRIGAVKELDDNRLVVLKREFVPSDLDDRLALGLHSIIQSAAETLAYNCDPKNSDNLYFQQVWGANTISPKFFPEIQQKARAELTVLSRNFDDYLSALEQQSDKSEAVGREVGVGLYYYEIPSNLDP